jgi:hypothetical protein
MSAVLEAWDHNEVMCSYKLNHAIGEHLAKHAQGRGILKSAYDKGVPVFVPAFSDSELGLDTALNNRLRESTGRHKIRFDPFEDVEHFAATLLRQKRLGIFTIGGGVPRNWSQQFGPFIELRHRRLGENLPLKRYHYGLRICPEPVYWGGLSGSPYSEAVSWGKFVPPAEGGKFGEVFLDATVGLPLIVAAVLERLDADKKSHRAAKSKNGKTLRRPPSGNNGRMSLIRQAKLRRKSGCSPRALLGPTVDFLREPCDKRVQGCCSRSPRIRPETNPVTKSLPPGRGCRKAGVRGDESSAPPCLP